VLRHDPREHAGVAPPAEQGNAADEASGDTVAGMEVLSMRSKLWSIAGSVAAILLGAVSYQHFRFQLPGDVKDSHGQPIQGCKVELLIRWQPLENWTGYVSRDTVTNSSGAFSFNVFAPLRSTYRLRVQYPGYHEWLLEAPSAGAPKRVHITLFRVGQSRLTAEPTRG